MSSYRAIYFEEETLEKSHGKETESDYHPFVAAFFSQPLQGAIPIFHTIVYDGTPWNRRTIINMSLPQRNHPLVK